jgi:hypothetical protein
MPETAEEGHLAEVIRRGFRTLTEEGVDAWIEEFTVPDFVWDVESMGLGLYEGRAAYREFFDDWVSSYEEWFSEPEQIEEFAEDVTVQALRQGGRLRGSQQWVELRWAQVCLWEGNRVRRAVNYSTLDEARAAAEAMAENR